MTTHRHFTLFLQDILHACEECPTFLEGMSFEEFSRDRRTKLAVVKEIENIGEAASNIPEHIRQSAPEVPWQRIIGMRNRLAHEYFDVHYGIVWNTVHQYLPPLRRAIEHLLNEYSTSQG